MRRVPRFHDRCRRLVKRGLDHDDRHRAGRSRRAVEQAMQRDFHPTLIPFLVKFRAMGEVFDTSRMIFSTSDNPIEAATPATPSATQRRRRWTKLRDELRQFNKPSAAARQSQAREEREIAEYNHQQGVKITSYLYDL